MRVKVKKLITKGDVKVGEVVEMPDIL